MWRLYQTAKTWSQRPSDLLGVVDRWAALQFDNAVALFGLYLENALQEREQLGEGSNVRWVEKYTLSELLTPGFRLGGDEGAGDSLPLKADGLLYDEVG